MKRVLIPNRGEIALRVVRGCRRRGLETVVAASESDRHGLAARSADRVLVLGPDPPAQSYLSVEAVMQAAMSAGCDTIHPGYGFLAESVELAALAREQGLVFVGPPTDAMAVAMDPAATDSLARHAGLPPLPGPEPARSVRRIDVPFAVDGSGVPIFLSERDCSVQLGGEKLIEESPANLAPRIRDRLQQATAAVAGAISYAGLGAAQFALDPAGEEPWFVGIACTLDVGHAVTEVISRRDLVALQLGLAAGEELGFDQAGVGLTGHGIECRLKAEDVANGLTSSAGTLSLFSLPERPHLRVDTDCYAGAVISPYYDPLLATLIAHGPDRARAVELLLDSLQDVDVDGVETNRTLLAAVLGHPDFAGAAVTTDWLHRAIR